MDRPSHDDLAARDTDILYIPPKPPLPPQPQPQARTLPLPVVAPAAAAAPAAARAKRRRGRALVWTLAVVVVVAVMGVAGWFVGEAWAKSAVTSAVQQKTAAALGLPAGHEVDVTLAEPVLPQLIGGSLSTLAVTVPDAPIGGATGTVTLHATGIPVRGEGTPASADVAVALSPAALQKLAGAQSDIIPGSLHVVGSDVAVSLDPGRFLSHVGVTITLHPSVAAGRLVLTPASIDVAGFQMSFDVVRERFQSLAAGILAPRTFCVASFFPKGMTLKAISVAPDVITTDFTVDPRIVSDPSLQAKGTCG